MRTVLPLVVWAALALVVLWFADRAFMRRLRWRAWRAAGGPRVTAYRLHDDARATLRRLDLADRDAWDAEFLELLRSTGWQQPSPWYCPRCDGTGTGPHPHLAHGIRPPLEHGARGRTLTLAETVGLPAPVLLGKVPVATERPEGAPPPLPLPVRVYRESW